MQPRMTSLLCLRRSLAMRSSTFNCARRWQQRFLSSTYFRCFQTLHPANRPADQKILYRPTAMYHRAVPDDEQLAGDLPQEMPQEANHIFSLEGSLLLHHVTLALQADGAHN